MVHFAPDDPDLKSSLEGGGPRSGGGCALIRKIEIAKKRRKRQEVRGKKTTTQLKTVEIRSRTEPLRDEKVSKFQRRLVSVGSRMTAPHVILVYCHKRESRESIE